MPTVSIRSQSASVMGALWLALLSTTASASADALPIISWGVDAAAQASRLQITANRVGCGASLSACLARNTSGHPDKDSRIALSLPASRSPADILAAIDQFVSADPPPGQPYEIGLDDFAAIVRRGLQTNTLSSIGGIPEVIAHARTTPRLAATVYEDDLPYLESIKDSDLSRFRDGVQRVAFFLHYRPAVGAYTDYLNRVKRLFPNAEVFGGIYHYDRADYLPCQADSRVRCTDAEEYALFLKSVDVTLDAVRRGYLAGIELYPGRIGQEATWDGWSKSRTCRTSRQPECIATSQRMGQALVKKLEAR